MNFRTDFFVYSNINIQPNISHQIIGNFYFTSLLDYSIGHYQNLLFKLEKLIHNVLLETFE